MQLTLKSFIDLVPATDVLSTHNLTFADETYIFSVVIDSRELKNFNASGAVFFAFEGGVVDGHTYIETAIAECVILAIGTKSFTEITATTKTDSSHMPYIQVTDSLKVLQQVAKTYREQYLENVHIVGITGSVGKTTTKDMLAAACGELVASGIIPSPIYATKGNLNNHIGVPLSILAINPDQKVAIIEAGMNHRGEIQVLAEIMQPDTVIITKIGVAHMEYLGSQEEIAREKSDLVIYSSRAAKVYIPADDTYATFVQSYIQEKTSGKAEVVLVDTLESPLLTHMPKHIVDNISLTIACAKYLVKYLIGQQKLAADAAATTAATAATADLISDEILIKTVLQSQITPRRFEIKKISNDFLLIDDSYNANPDSMRASLKAFNDLDLSQYFEQDTLVAPQKIAVLGGMAELGAHSEMMHREITHFIEQLSNIDIVISVGELAIHYAFAHGLMHFKDIQSAASVLQEKITQSPCPLAILVKGSKSTYMSGLADILAS